MPTKSPLILNDSPYTPSQTIEQIKHILITKGITIFAILDHGQAAKNVSLSLSDTQIVVFGDPTMGTLLMEENPEIGIELPLKIIVWQDDQKMTRIGYKDPTLLGPVYGIEKNLDLLKKMKEGLAQIVKKLILGRNGTSDF